MAEESRESLGSASRHAHSFFLSFSLFFLRKKRCHSTAVLACNCSCSFCSSCSRPFFLVSSLAEWPACDWKITSGSVSLWLRASSILFRSFFPFSFFFSYFLSALLVCLAPIRQQPKPGGTQKKKNTRRKGVEKTAVTHATLEQKKKFRREKLPPPPP